MSRPGDSFLWLKLKYWWHTALNNLRAAVQVFERGTRRPLSHASFSRGISEVLSYGQVLQLIECLPSVRATGFLTTPLLDCHWLVIEASPKTNGCSKKSIHLQVAFLERTNVTNVCV